VVRALLANYVVVPAATVGLLLAFQAPSTVAAGFLILAVCPGAPYGPPFTALARGDGKVAVGLMVVLAGSSAILAPILLAVLLPRVAADEPLTVDATRVAGTLLLTQLVPLGVGIGIRQRWPRVAEQWQNPANRLAKLLNLLAAVSIISIQFHQLTEIRLRGFVGMLILLIASWAAGWLLGGTNNQQRKTLTLTTSLRNVGVGLVIATGTFGGTAAVTATLTYGLFEVVGTLLLATWWRRRAPPLDTPGGERQAFLS
jgi:BASS family bile acid:Na+ symporter